MYKMRCIVAHLILAAGIISSGLDITAGQVDDEQNISGFVQKQDSSHCDTFDYDIPEAVREAACTYDGSEDDDSSYNIRMYEEEKNLNTIVLGNGDDGRIMYTFAYPVKYKDEDGIIRDMSLEVTDSREKGMAYETKCNNIITSFPDKLSDGIRLEHEDNCIVMTPLTDKKDVSLCKRKSEENTVAYES